MHLHLAPKYSFLHSSSYLTTSPIFSFLLILSSFLIQIEIQTEQQPLEKYTYSFRERWLSDPSTYPIIVVMGCALTFMTGASIHALTCYKDVQIDPAKRNSKLQTWGKEDKYTPLVGKAIGWNMYGKEGLGVDHEKWQKEHEAYLHENQK